MATYRLLHLSDTHVSRTGPDEDGVDGLAALQGMLHDLADLPDLDGVLVSGDVADDGSAQGCAAVREMVGAFAAERRIPHIYCPGNHDRRDGFRAALGSGHLGADGKDLGRTAGPNHLGAVSMMAGLRVITLDSLVEGRTEGELGDDQLAWLADELRRPAPHRSGVVRHHPPISTPSITYQGSVVLQRPERLAAALAGTDVQVVLCGHLHHQVSGRCGDIDVWTTPGVVTRIDLTAPPHLVRGVVGASASVVELGGPHTPLVYLVHARDPRAGEQVYAYDPAIRDAVEG